MSTNLTRRQDVRPSAEVMMDNILHFNKIEDRAAHEWANLHNSIPDFDTHMTAVPIGNRTELKINHVDDPGDSCFTFIGLNETVSINVEIKCRGKIYGDQFRPRLLDVENCLRKHRPYVLIFGYPERQYVRVSILSAADLGRLQYEHSAGTGEYIKGKWVEVYGGKEYYIENAYRFPGVDFSNFLDDNKSYETYNNMLEVLWDISRKQDELIDAISF